ncbi:MAG: FAD-binding oxidoreductase [Rudaea sp.]
MKRWNGWGNVTVDFPVPPEALSNLQRLIGEGIPPRDATLQQALASVGPPRIPPHSLLQTDALTRLLHARGQSLPNWVALRSGRIDDFPDAVAFPATDSDIRSLLSLARQSGAGVIPYGGGTSVVGHINIPGGGRPVLSVDMSRFDTLHSIDQVSRLATVGAGLTGPAVEELLRPFNLTLGHFPQSWEFSTVGGWIATRSSGQLSLYYGRIEDLVAGVHVETPSGPLDLPPLPASAAGPDLRHIVLGSEGRLGLITLAALRVRKRPAREVFLGAFFPRWQTGVEAVRAIVQSGIAVSMLRLSDPAETETTLVLSGKPQLSRIAEAGLRRIGHEEPSLLIYGVTGDRESVNLARFQTEAIARHHGGLPVPFVVGSTWRKSRFRLPYLRNFLWQYGYAIDTLETALPWSSVTEAAGLIKSALSEALLPHDEHVLAFAHLSHVYCDGASIYVTFLFRISPDPDETLSRWAVLKNAASQVIVGLGGTISHQHGVGVDHAPFLIAEKSAVGISMLHSAFAAVDPDGLMNPGKLLEDAS